MTVRVLRKTWYAVVLLLVAMGGITACNLFGGGQGPPPTATLPPPPTETPLPVLPTFTPTPTTVVLPSPTPTKVVEPTTAMPTLTPTTQAPEVGGEQPQEPAPEQPQRVSYVVKKIPTVGNTLVNGSFEEGFQENGVGSGWAAWDNGGVGKRTWMEELQPVHVSHGERAQLLELTGAGNVDRYIGIYQTVDVVAGETYTLSMHGLIRSSDAGNDNAPYGHRIQWGIDYEGRGSWQEVDEWFDTGWNDVKLDDPNPTMNYVSLPITAESDKLSLFIRGWTKWPNQPISKYYVDGIFLEGQVPGKEQVVKVAVGGEEGMPTTGGSAIWIPIAGVLLVIGFAIWEVRRASKSSP